MAARMPLADYPAQRIAIIKPSALGDIVHALPVLTAVRGRYQDAHITWLVNQSYQGLLQGHPDLTDSLAFDRGASRKGFLASLKSFTSFLVKLRSAKFDLVIDLQGLARTGLMTMATGAPRRVGLSSAREGAAWAYTDCLRVPKQGVMHAVDRYWLVAEALGVGDAPKEFRFPSHQAERHWLTTTLHSYPRPWLAFGVGARWITKRWLPEHFGTLARWAQQAAGGTIFFVGGPEERPLVDTARSDLTGPVCDLVGRTTLPQLTRLLGAVDLMVANDTGPMHLAAALGTSVISPYTCTEVRRTGPYGNFRRAVESPIWCQGSYLKKCGRLECMQALTPDRLWPLMLEILQPWLKNCRSA